jgi:hypothetical protein
VVSAPLSEDQANNYCFPAFSRESASPYHASRELQAQIPS